MTNRELKHIIESIKAGEGIELAGIAEKAKVNRSHLSTLVNSYEVKEITESYIGKIRRQYPLYFNNQQHPTLTASNTDANLEVIAQSLARLENGQTMIRAELRGYGQYQIQESVAWDQKKFLAAMAKVSMIVGANLQVGDDQTDSNGKDGK